MLNNEQKQNIAPGQEQPLAGTPAQPPATKKEESAFRRINREVRQKNPLMWFIMWLHAFCFLFGLLEPLIFKSFNVLILYGIFIFLYFLFRKPLTSEEISDIFWIDMIRNSRKHDK